MKIKPSDIAATEEAAKKIEGYVIANFEVTPETDRNFIDLTISVNDRKFSLTLIANESEEFELNVEYDKEVIDDLSKMLGFGEEEFDSFDEALDSVYIFDVAAETAKTDEQKLFEAAHVSNTFKKTPRTLSEEKGMYFLDYKGGVLAVLANGVKQRVLESSMISKEEYKSALRYAQDQPESAKSEIYFEVVLMEGVGFDSTHLVPMSETLLDANGGVMKLNRLPFQK